MGVQSIRTRTNERGSFPDNFLLDISLRTGTQVLYSHDECLH